MDVKENKKVYSVILVKDGQWDDFYRIANMIETKLNTRFKNQLSDFDTKYWDFDYLDKEIVLHFHEMVGDVEIFTNKENGKTVLIETAKRIK